MTTKTHSFNQKNNISIRSKLRHKYVTLLVLIVFGLFNILIEF